MDNIKILYWPMEDGRNSMGFGTDHTQKIALIIPIYNAEQEIPVLFHAIMRQSLQPDRILVIDSSSTDRSLALLSAYPVQIHSIAKADFDHGGTRKLATQLITADIYLYLTQDAIPADDHTFANLIMHLIKHENVGCAYGRQLPKADANPISAHARLFNYSAESYVRSFGDRNIYGIKTCFNSDSFAAYKREALLEIGNFPEHLITGEDAYVAAKMLKAGFAVGYAADAMVFHSHNLSLVEEFHRYFSIGVFHGREAWLLKDFHSATGEGLRFVKSEIKFLCKRQYFHLIPKALLSTFVKYFAYQLGLHEKILPHIIKIRLGINRSFWFKTLKSPA